MKLFRPVLSAVTIALLAACSATPGSDPSESNQTPAITSFGANPNPVPVNIASQFSWSVTGEGLVCQLDVDNNGTIDYTVQNCTSSSRVSHQYTVLGKYTAKLTVITAGGPGLSQTTPVEVGAANQAPIPILKVGVPGKSGQSQGLGVKFTWTVSDPNSDVTRCQLDADGDGTWEYDALCSGLAAQSVGPSDLVNYYFEYTYSQMGRYLAVLQASDAFQGSQSKVEVRVPLNRAPVIENMEASVENGRLKVNYRVSDPDGDPLACVVKVEGVGRFAYQDCRSPIQTYPTMGKDKFNITLEASDPYETSSRFIKYADAAESCQSLQRSDWSNSQEESPSRLFWKVFDEKDWVTILAVSPDCRRVVGATLSGQFLMWEYGKLGAEPTVFGPLSETPNFVERLEFSPDSRFLVASGCILNSFFLSGGQQASIWDLSGARPRQLSTAFADQTICSSSFSPDGSTLALGSTNFSNQGKIYFMKGSNPGQVLDVKEMDGGVMALDYSPNGNLLAASEVDFASPNIQDPTIEIPDLPSPFSSVTDAARKAEQLLATLELPSVLKRAGVAFQTDWKKVQQGPITWTGESTVKIYDGRNPTDPIEVVSGFAGFVNNLLEFTPDGSDLIGVSTLVIFSLGWRIPVVNDVLQANDGTLLDIPSGLLFLSTNIDFSPDGTWLALPSFLDTIPTFMYNLESGVTEGIYLTYGFAVFTPDNRKMFGTGLINDGLAIGEFTR